MGVVPRDFVTPHGFQDIPARSARSAVIGTASAEAETCEHFVRGGSHLLIGRPCR